MTTTEIFIVLTFAACIHASFQLSVSVMTLMSGHALGKQASSTRVVRLMTSYIFGAGIMTMLLLSFLALTFLALLPAIITPFMWSILCGMIFGIGISVLFFYFRKADGTVLWIPRPIARYISGRAKQTNLSGEAFGLGLSSILGEFLFYIAPLTVAALVLIHTSPLNQLLGILIYTAISILPHLFVASMLGGGRSVSKIQKWRETNKRFMQFIAGGALVILAIYLYVNFVTALMQDGGAWII